MYSMAALYSLELGSEIPRLDIIAFVSADTAPEAGLEVEADEDLVLLLLLVASLLAFNKEAAVSPLLRVLLERPPVPMEEVLLENKKQIIIMLLVEYSPAFMIFFYCSTKIIGSTLHHFVISKP